MSTSKTTMQKEIKHAHTVKTIYTHKIVGDEDRRITRSNTCVGNLTAGLSTSRGMSPLSLSPPHK